MTNLRVATIVTFAALLLSNCSTAVTQRAIESPAKPAVAADTIEKYRQLPLSFESNKGQIDPRVDFQARGPGYAVFLNAAEAVLAVPRNGSDGNTAPVVVRMRLMGANRSAGIRGVEPLPGTISYFRGKDPAKWKQKIPQYARVRYDGIYPGVDVVYYGRQGRLEHDFVVAPGGDPRAINLQFEGADAVEIDQRGDLVLRINGGHMRLSKPHIYQSHGSIVEGGYVRKGARGIGFAVGDYDRREPLIIDPVLEYSTHLGSGTLDDFFNRSAIAVDAAGSVYMTGQALLFPTTPGSYQPVSRGDDEVFVAKLAPDGSRFIYATYIGGSSYDRGSGIAVDASGQAYVVGETFSADFPGGGPGAFAAKLSADGTRLLSSVNLGSSSWFQSVAVDGSGNAYALNGGTVTKLSATGAILYSRSVGGRGRGIAVDVAGSAYVTGDTGGWLPATAGVLQPAPGGGDDAFVVKLNPSGTGIVYATYLGGSATDYGADIVVDRDGNAYVTGETSSVDFPVTSSAFQQTLTGVFPTSAFVSKVSPTGSTLVYSTFLSASDPAGNTLTRGSGIAVDASGSVYITGTGRVPPVNAFQSFIFPSGSDAFVAKLNPSLAGASGLVFSTQLGGNTTDKGHDIAVDSSGNAYVCGRTRSDDFQTVKPLQSSLGGGFVAKIAATAVYADLSVTMTASPDPPSLGTDLTYTVTVTNLGPDKAPAVDVIDRPNFDGVSFSASQGSCAPNNVCALGPIEAGGHATVTIVGQANSYITYTNEAFVRSSISDANADNNSAVATAKPVGPPIAVIEHHCAAFACFFNASRTSDNGTITSYAWEFGDGGTASGQTASHTYAEAGTYTVKLTVTDNDGLTSSQTQEVAVPVPVAPLANFVYVCDGPTCSFDASSSSDIDGTIVSYHWDFGDGSTGSGVIVSHTFPASGYEVTLTVIDDDGLSGWTSQIVEFAFNAPPVSVFTTACVGLSCSFDASGSSDPDGFIASYTWSYGDGTSGSGSTVSHTYAANGSYVVTLTVTSNDGANATQTLVVTVANSPPVAAFTANCAELSCSFVGAGTDSDGTITSYAWSFGDGSAAAGPSASHTYAASGSYAVTLVVTDNHGATNAQSRTVTVNPPSVHVGDLDASSASQQNTWTATVMATLHDRAHGPVASATVSGAWSNGTAGSCTTNGSGQCTLSNLGITKKLASVTFTIVSVVHGTSVYSSAQNHDPDAESNGTTISVVRR